jgi:hypothetical protein
MLCVVRAWLLKKCATFGLFEWLIFIHWLLPTQNQVVKRGAWWDEGSGERLTILDLGSAFVTVDRGSTEFIIIIIIDIATITRFADSLRAAESLAVKAAMGSISFIVKLLLNLALHCQRRFKVC